MEHRLSGTLPRLLSPDKERLPKIVDGIEAPEYIEDLPPEEYHNDRSRMSSSGIVKMLHSPRQFLKFWSGYEEDEDADHFRIGRAAHLMLLEPKKFREIYVVEPVHQGWTKDGKPTTSTNAQSVKDAAAAWLLAQPKGACIVTQEELDDIVGMIESVLEHPVACEMLKSGKPETTLRWTDRETGIRCKARPDYLVNDRNGDLHLIDFKTTRDIRAGIFSADAHRLRYGTRMAFYHDGVVEALGRQPKTITLIAAEKKSPYEAAVYPLDDSWFENGQREYRHSMKLLEKCLKTGKWPAQQVTAQVLSMPNRAIYDQLPEFDFE